MIDSRERSDHVRAGRCLTLGVLWVLAAGCLAPRPEHVAEAEWGRVWADDVELARTVAGELDQLAPRVCAELSPATCPHVDVWLQVDLGLFRWLEQPADVGGFTVDGWNRVHVRIDPRLPRQAILAHELAHASMDDTWRALPWAFEEGLADWIATVVAEDGADLVAMRAEAAAFGIDGPAVGYSLHGRFGARNATFSSSIPRVASAPAVPWPPTFPDVDRRSAESGWRGLGHVAVARAIERRGLEALRSLCASAEAAGRDEVAVADVLALAGLGDDRDEWRRAIEDVARRDDAPTQIIIKWPDDGASSAASPGSDGG